jgi:DNA-binding beta-propeller fold protein YncE
MSLNWFLQLTALGILAQTVEAAPGAVPTYQLVAQIPVAGDGGWDYLSIDPQARRLYVAHADHVDELDIDHNTLLGTIADTPGVHGFAIAHELGRGFASDGATSQVSVVDLKSRGTISRVDTGTGPDAIVFVPSTREVYSFNGRGQSATVFNASSGSIAATIVLPGKPEFSVVDTEANRVLVNIEDKNLVVAIDAHDHKIVALWQITPCDSPSGLALDAAHHRLFVGCRNQRMLMVDAQSGHVEASVPIGKFVDANAFDPGTQLAFSSNGDGTLTIAQEVSPHELRIVQSLSTQPGARTMALDPVTHRIYLATADRAPAIVPGSFRLLVYQPTVTTSATASAPK